jgi:alcohol dehydrogenase class IV
VHRVAVICDENLARLGLLQRVSDSLRDAGLRVTEWTGGAAEPAVGLAIEAAAALAPLDPQAIVGLGGGSNLDVAKMVAVLLTHGGRPEDYFGFQRVPGPTRAVIAIPTTAGTGSEVSHSAVLTDPVGGIKVSTLSPFLRPTLALVDPSLTDSAPSHVTAESGIDALVHAVEASTARRWDQLGSASLEARAYEGAHPLGTLLAREAIRLIGGALERAVHNGADLAARDDMALAATYAGMAFSNCGVALVHALEYPIGAEFHCSHGAGNGLLLPYVLEFNIETRQQELAEIEWLLAGQRDHRPPAVAAEAAIERIRSLRERIGIPNRLRELHVPPDRLPELAQKASRIERLIALNPRDAGPAELLQILERAW